MGFLVGMKRKRAADKTSDGADILCQKMSEEASCGAVERRGSQSILIIAATCRAN